MRLRCRAHNQYEAERAFGAGFMSRKRHEARLAAAEARARAGAQKQSRDVVTALRGLGCRADEARRAALFSGTLHGATLEERMRAALTFLSRRSIQGRTPADAMERALFVPDQQERHPSAPDVEPRRRGVVRQ
jgi:hypothetical protein